MPELQLSDVPIPDRLSQDIQIDDESDGQRHIDGESVSILRHGSP